MPDLGGLFSGFFEAAATLALLFIIVGWVCSKLVEIGQAVRNSHGRMLRQELERCFGDDDDARRFTRYLYWHPIIEPLTQPNTNRLTAWLRRGESPDRYPPGRLPAYIAPETFAAAMLNPVPWPATEEPLELLLAANQAGDVDLDSLPPELTSLPGKLSSARNYVEKPGNWRDLLHKALTGGGASVEAFDPLFAKTPVDIHAPFGKRPSSTPDKIIPLTLTEKLYVVWCRNRLVPSSLRARMVALIQDSEEDVDRLRASIGRWYGEMMDRVTGRFKRRALFYIFAIAFLICLLLNIDSARIFTSIVQNADRRASIEEARAAGGSSDEIVSLEQKRRFLRDSACLHGRTDDRRECLATLLRDLWRNPARANPTRGISFPEPRSTEEFREQLRPVRNDCAAQDSANLCSPALATDLNICIDPPRLEAAQLANLTPVQRAVAEEIWRPQAEARSDKSCRNSWRDIWRSSAFFWDVGASSTIAAYLSKTPPATAASGGNTGADAWKETKERLEATRDDARRSTSDIEKAIETLPGVGFFWKLESWQAAGLLERFYGLLGIGLSALLAALGAPFWYDLLGRISRRGATGPKPGGA